MQKLRQIGTALVGSLLAGATLIGGALAGDLGDFPSPFASSTAVDSVIVVGANAATADVVGAINVGAVLAQTGVATTTTSTGSLKVAGGTKVETSSKKLRLNDSTTPSPQKWGSLYEVRNSLTSTDMDALADYTLTYADGTTTKINQIIGLGVDSYVTFGEDDPAGIVKTPRPVLRVDTNSLMYNLTLLAPAGMDVSTSEAEAATFYKASAPGLAGQNIVIVGNKFTFGTTTQVKNNSLVLFGGGEEKTIYAGGDPITFTLDGKTHTIKMTSWIDATTDKAVLDMDGTTYTKAAGSSITVDATTGSQITVDKVNLIKTTTPTGGAATESAYAVIFIGSRKVTLTDSSEVQIGDKTISGSKAYFSYNNEKINTVTVEYKPDEYKIAEAGGSIADPIFGALKFGFSGINPAIEAAAKDKVSIRKSGNTVRVEFPTKQGDTVGYDVWTLFAANDWRLGPTSTGEFEIADKSQTVNKTDYFLVSDGTYTHILQYTSVDTTNNILKLKDVGGGGTIEVGYTGTSGTLYLGSAQFALTNITEASPYFFIVNDACVSDCVPWANTVPITTRGGARIAIGGYNGTGSAGLIAYQTDTTPWFVFTEEDDLTDTDKKSFNVTVGVSATSSTSIGDVSLTETSTNMTGYANVADTNVYRALSIYGTYIIHDTDSESVTFYYPDDQTTADVYVLEASATMPSGTTSTTSVSVPSLGNGISKLDTEAEADKTTKHLILVGGPAVNTLVAELGTAGKTMSLTDWRATDTAGAYTHKGEAIIQVVDNAFTTGKSALVVAGFDAADTTRATNILLKHKTYSTQLKTKAKVVVTGTTASPVFS